MNLYLAFRVGATLIRQPWNAQRFVENARSIVPPLAFRTLFNIPTGNLEIVRFA